MDIQDVSTVAQFAAMVKQAQANGARAGRRKGEIPKDHAPTFLQVQMHMMIYQQVQRQKCRTDRDQSFQMITTQIPAAYPPCTRSAAELKPISISEMGLETHHRGRKVVVRVLVPARRINAVMAVVEDEKGTGTLLQVYYQPEEEVVPAEEVLRCECFYLIKEPYFKATTSDGSYSLRIDHPGDLVFLSEGNELIPPKWRKSKTIFGTSNHFRVQGNEAVGKKNWAWAEELYTLAIEAAKTAEDEQPAYLNRSLANLRLGRPATALSDAVKGSESTSGPPSEKGLFRQASALYQLGKFEQCQGKLELLTATYPSSSSNGEASAMMSRTISRITEQQTGAYIFAQMYKQAKATPPLIDCATYSAPVEVRESPGRGRGLFTTRKVTAGELLVCEKAFGYSYVGKDKNYGGSRLVTLMNLTTNRAVAGGQASLLTQIVQKMYHDPESSQAFRKLYHGDYKPVSVAEVDGKPVVDSFLVEKIMALNVFGAPRTSRESVAVRTTNLASDKDREVDSTFHTCGIWYLASHINHACASNCRRSFIGDMQTIRTARDLDEGTELFFWYHVPAAFESYGETQKGLKTWGFTCDCAICLEKKSTPDASVAKRRTLKRELRRALGGTPQQANIAKTLKVLQQLEQLYSSAATKPGAVKLELWESYFALGQAYFVRSKLLDAVEMTLKGFEALGFIVAACPRRGTAKSAKPIFRIEQWGMAVDESVNAFVRLFQAYESLAPELAAAVRDHAVTAYTIVIGEKGTFLDTYPELK